MKEFQEEMSTALPLSVMHKLSQVRLKQISEDALEDDKLNDEWNELSKLSTILLNLMKIKAAQDKDLSKDTYSLCKMEYIKKGE